MMKGIKKIYLKKNGEWIEVDEVEVRVEFERGHLELTVKNEDASTT